MDGLCLHRFNGVGEVASPFFPPLAFTGREKFFPIPFSFLVTLEMEKISQRFFFPWDAEGDLAPLFFSLLGQAE